MEVFLFALRISLVSIIEIGKLFKCLIFPMFVYWSLAEKYYNTLGNDLEMNDKFTKYFKGVVG